MVAIVTMAIVLLVYVNAKLMVNFAKENHNLGASKSNRLLLILLLKVTMFISVIICHLSLTNSIFNTIFSASLLLFITNVTKL